MSILQVKVKDRHDQIRLAALWHWKVPQLQKKLRDMGIVYPSEKVFADREKYRVALINLIIEEEQRIV